MYALLAVNTGALNAQQDTQVERGPIWFRRAAVSAHGVARHAPQDVHGAVRGRGPCEELAAALGRQGTS